MAGHEYVVDVALVQEIIRPTDLSIDLNTGLMHVDGAPEYVEGVVKRRGRIVPVVDLRKHLGLKVSPPTAETCVIIAKLPGGPVGFMVDSASELAWVKTHDFEVPSPVMAGVDGKLCSDYLQGMAHLGDRLLVMLDLERLFTPGEQHELSESGDFSSTDSGYRRPAVSQQETRGHGRRPAPARKPALETLFSGEIDAKEVEEEQEQARARASVRRLVAFELRDELYGIPVTDVAEIREPPAITPLPHVPPHVLGLINLRGVVLPVIDLRKRFGLNPKADGPDNRLIVLKALRRACPERSQRAQGKGPGYPVALWVDSVHGLVRLPGADFQPAPPGVARIDSEYYDQVTIVDGRMLIELNVQKMLADTAIGAEGSGTSKSASTSPESARRSPRT
jgi:purine-binding chemotaxis protein CheW